MLNCNNAKKIDFYSYLKKNSFKLKKENEKEAWFLSPFRVEKTESFKIDKNRNIYYDFSEGCGGTIIDFVMKYNNCSVKEALIILSSDTFSFHQQPKIIEPNKEPSYSITKVTELTNLNLINYLKKRKIDIELAKKYCFQVHYKFKGYNEFYGIGFMNDFGGFEIRNSIYKICLYKKAITTINNNSDTVCLFESFSDFLSYLTLNKNNLKNENYIILNSTSLVKKAVELISNFKTVKTLFDNDFSGRKTAQTIKENCINEFEDCSFIYKNFNDFNEYLISIKSI